jgi:putative phosphoesterase
VRVAALSDIHGNQPALEAVLADVDREGVDAIVVAGDVISGPWPGEVFDALESRRSMLVRGNADRVVIERDDRYGELAVWSADRLGDRRLAIARGWPLTLELDVDGVGWVLVCHSTPESDDPIYTTLTPDDEMARVLGPVAADVVVCGHTHIQYDRRLSTGLRVVNPGSVGMPYEGRRGAFWALLGPEVELRRSDYDVEAAFAAIEARGAPIEELQIRNLLDPPDPRTAAEYFESLRGA